ncbi:MAG TPA: TnpV protein [Lachnospiraceae bacterium]|nr:TnpV protein [Lachnospiraceae bacterium]
MIRAQGRKGSVEMTTGNLTGYGILRREYLKNHCSAMYQELLWTGDLWEHISGIQKEAEELHGRLEAENRRRLGVTEELKKQDVAEWIRLANLAAEAAKERVLNGLIYTNPEPEGMEDPFGAA